MAGGAACAVTWWRRAVGGLAACAALVAVAGCGGGSDVSDAGQATAPVRTEPPVDQQLLAQGRRVYGEHCASCHGLNGRPHTGTTGEYGPNFDDVEIRDAAYVRHRLEYGGYGMQSFSDEISEEGKRAVVAFVLAVAGRNVADRADADETRIRAGRAVFDAMCRACHRLEGSGATASREQVTFLGTDLDVVRPSARRIRRMIEHGDWWMPSLRGSLGDGQVEDVIAYVTKVAGGGRFEDPNAAGQEPPESAPPPLSP